MKVESSKLENDYKDLKSKYTKKVKENKTLKSQLDVMVESMQNFQVNYNNIVNLYSSITESIKMLPKKDDTSSFSTQATSDMKTVRKNTNLQDPNPLFIKKLEEMESNFLEMSKSFNQLVLKYKILKDERDDFEKANNSLKEEIEALTSSREDLMIELKYKDNFIERFKELNRCLIDAGINGANLNTYEHKRDSTTSQSRSSSPYIVCEPLPSFLKFINKFTNNC
jgi:hypothetical protein